MKGKKGFGVFLIVVLLFLVFLWAREVFSQKMQSDSLWIFFEKGSTVVPEIYSVALSQAAEKIKIGWTAQLFADADSLRWKSEGKKKSLAVDGGLVIARCQSVARALGLKSFYPGVLTGHDQRTVLVTLSPPVPPDSTAEQLANLEGQQKKTDLRLKNFDDRLAYVESLVSPPKWTTGLGAMGVYFDADHAFVIPTLELTLNLSPKFGLGAVGGVCPTGTAYGRRLWSNAVNVYAFSRPSKLPVLFLVGYSHASEIVEVGEYLWAVNSGLVGAQLDLSLGNEWKLSASVNCLATDDRIGINGGFFVSKSW